MLWTYYHAPLSAAVLWVMGDACELYEFAATAPLRPPRCPASEVRPGAVLVLDNGSYQCRAGWAGQDTPRLVFRALQHRPKAKARLFSRPPLPRASPTRRDTNHALPPAARTHASRCALPARSLCPTGPQSWATSRLACFAGWTRRARWCAARSKAPWLPATTCRRLCSTTRSSGWAARARRWHTRSCAASLCWRPPPAGRAWRSCSSRRTAALRWPSAPTQPSPGPPARLGGTGGAPAQPRVCRAAAWCSPPATPPRCCCPCTPACRCPRRRCAWRSAAWR